MNSERAVIARVIAAATNRSFVEIESTQTCTGGCIHRAELVHLSDGCRFFVKYAREQRAIECEAAGLKALAATQTLRIPQVIAFGKLSDAEVQPARDGKRVVLPKDHVDNCYLILEAIEEGKPKKDFWEEFGASFARLHRLGRAESFGYEHDNYIGATPQINSWNNDWIEFFANNRLSYQLKLAINNRQAPAALIRGVEALIDRIDEALACEIEYPALQHGDLWSGNFLVDPSGGPVVIDPAVYYGHRECDLAMPLLFGGFPSGFLSGYQQVWPLNEGWQQRVAVYQLYHLLNHLNLFGGSYLGNCMETLGRIS
ncbi:MAG: fructosamine kinase family protein [Planctomycetales bacterium]|nr:fructosamine kinase family protein [Planctomycetales bacterium]